MNRLLQTILLSVLLGSAVSTAQEATDHWPRFRGPNADGVAADDPRLPSTWNTTENVKWVADVPGWGWSCPVVWGDRVFLTTVVSDAENTAPQKGLYLGEGVRSPGNLKNRSYDLSGKLLWELDGRMSNLVIPSPFASNGLLYIAIGL